MKYTRIIKWRPGRERLATERPVRDKKTLFTSKTESDVHKRYVSPLTLSKWLLNALKCAKCHIP